MKALVQIVLAVVCYAIFIVLIGVSGINLVLTLTMWDKVPTDWHMRVVAWNGLLIINVLCTGLMAALTFLFVLFRGYGKIRFVMEKS